MIKAIKGQKGISPVTGLSRFSPKISNIMPKLVEENSKKLSVVLKNTLTLS
jgi:hypothetical protein